MVNFMKAVIFPGEESGYKRVQSDLQGQKLDTDKSEWLPASSLACRVSLRSCSLWWKPVMINRSRRFETLSVLLALLWCSWMTSHCFWPHCSHIYVVCVCFCCGISWGSWVRRRTLWLRPTPSTTKTRRSGATCHLYVYRWVLVELGWLAVITQSPFTLKNFVCLTLCCCFRLQGSWRRSSPINML